MHSVKSNINRTLISLFLIFAACSSDPIPATDEMALEAGRLIASESFRELSGHLGEALGEGGVSYAIEFCSVEAIPITQRLSERFGVEIKRATHMPRNPDNAANEQEMEIIDTWINRLNSGDNISPVPLSGKDDYLRVYSPIVITNQLCLQCHGNTENDIDPENLELIRSIYQNDRAVNFEMGDLRGMWSIRMPADSVSVAAIIEMVKN